MSAQKIIAIVGGTGAQGGGLARAILNDPAGGYVPRVLTRDPGSSKARALADAGAEVVAADVNAADSLEQAFAGAYGAYCVTFFWEHFSPATELAQARAMAVAAKSAGLRHLIWSTLEDTRHWVPLDDERMPTLMGHYKVPHFDAKGEANHFFADAGVPTTYMLTSFYWDNLIHFGMGPRRDAKGRLTFTLPMGDQKLPGIAAEDIGRCAYGLFKQGETFVGRTVGVAGEHLTGAEMAVALSSALGQEVGYQDIPPEVYRGLGFPGAEDLGNMFQFKRDFNQIFCGARDVAFSRSLNPDLMTFAAWLAQHKDRLPLD